MADDYDPFGGAGILYLFAISIGIPTIIGYSILLCFYCRAYRSSKWVFGATAKPYIPWDMKYCVEYKGNDWRKTYLPEPRVFVNARTIENRSIEPRSIRKVKEIVRVLMDIRKPLRCETPKNAKSVYSDEVVDRYEYPIPHHARTVSIPMRGFVHGEEPHEFVPVYGKKEQGYYTYQIYGDFRLQVTRYYEDGEKYVAGFCIYIGYSQQCGVAFPDFVMYALYKSTYYAGDQVTTDFLRGIGFEDKKFHIAEEARIRREIARMERGGSDDEDEEETPILSPQVENTFEIEIVNEENYSIKSSILNFEEPEVEYTDRELEVSPSLTPESLRVRAVPLAASEKSSINGFEASQSSMEHSESQEAIRSDSDNVSEGTDLDVQL